MNISKANYPRYADARAPKSALVRDCLRAFVCGGINFFELACAISGYLLGVNPFNQPGVEAYKNNMFALLGKPGFEEARAALENRLA